MWTEAGLLADGQNTRAQERPATGIVHLGLGAFFRAFGCVYITDAMAASGGDWGVVGVSLRSPQTRDALRKRDWSYTSVSLAPEGDKLREIAVLNDVLVAPENPKAVIVAMADPAVKIVTLTVTEKGYCHNPATGTLNLDHPDIQHDLAHNLPVSAPGYLVRALAMRHAAGHAPFTVLTCDNLPENGKLVRGLVLELAAQVDPFLADWIEAEGRFPSTMVDRITPATTDADIARIAILTDSADAAPVMHEPFAQWAVEDNFVDGARPDLEAAGVEMVRDVTAHEHMKLRMLNGTHSALAYIGYLAGHETIADTMADPVLAGYARALWAEIMPAVQAPEGVSLPVYANALFERYTNPAIRHRTWQIAMDGSQKLPQRILGTLRENMAEGRKTDGLCIAVAAWMRYVSGIDEAGQPIDVRDPLAERLRDLAAGQDTPANVVTAILTVEDIFSADLADQLRDPVTKAAEKIWSNGVRATLRELTS
ncbi:mannitol dehydrogenase family protein [Thalassobacter stenotrophicus]|uniref:mannitol dehydrogenase family protein n=1 Tax=Thalassobacter stenotrophicus TaxID=266809 RepID=UPI0022A95117|nr:mannitol dehydrogenase family protein [Thalassobacter stenotrophicus]UYP67575.1 mannitol dehydrogenase family protein [Thalassobacter stenotrophicus]